jgi:hypothetical protein
MIKCYECHRFHWNAPGQVPQSTAVGVKGRWGFCDKHWPAVRADDLHFAACPNIPTIRERREALANEEESE